MGQVGASHLVPFSALPPEGKREASPKTISRRTSYCRVRLAFHRYPQLIPMCCTTYGFGPPPPFTVGSPWPWVDHSVSGLVSTIINKLGISHFRNDKLSNLLGRVVNARFHCDFVLFGLNQLHSANSLVHSSIGTPSSRTNFTADLFAKCE